MDFDGYQILARKTAVYPGVGKNYVYPALGLGGESGEVLEKVKKLLRDKDGNKDYPGFAREITEEMGDVLWYLANLACEFNLSLNQIALANLRKLQSREERGQLQGNGDDR